MKNKQRFLVKNKQSLSALFVLLIMVFNACNNPATGTPEGNNASDFTPMYFYVDSDGKFTETDSGRTVLVADDKAKVVFYSDNIGSRDDDFVSLTFEDKIIIFLFEKDRNFPSRIVLSNSEESFNGIFTPYDPVTQIYGLTIEQGGEEETLSNIALSKDIFTKYKDVTEFTPSQNLRMHNLYIAMCIYKSLDDFFKSNDTLQVNRGFFSWIAKKVAPIFFPPPVVSIVVGTVSYFEGVKNLLDPSNIIKEILHPGTYKDIVKDIKDSIDLVCDGVRVYFPIAVTANPIAADYTISGTGTFTYNGSTMIVTVTPKTGKSAGAVTVKYNGNTVAPSAIGTYTVTFDVAAAAGFSAASGLSAGTLTIKAASSGGGGGGGGSSGGGGSTAKGNGAAVSTPTLNTITNNSITINAVSAPSTGQSVEYAINTSNSAPSSGWQTTTIFSGLNAGTTYYIFARSASNNSYNTGTASSSLAVTTLQTVSADRLEYYWVDQHDKLVTTSGGATTIATGSTLVITAQTAGYIVKNWYLDGIKTEETGNTYNFSSTTTGKHTVSVVVEKSGKPYNTNITITVQ